MKVIHLIGGGDVGGAKSHVLSLVKELGKHIEVKLISFRSGIFADDAREMGINVEVIYSKNIISDIKRVIKIIRDEKYQLIHSHGAKANMIAVIVKRFVKVPTVTTVHSDYRLDYMQSIIKRLSFGIINTIALRFIDNYIGVSKNFKEMLIKRNFDPGRIYTVYNGITFDDEIREYSRAEFAKKYGIPLEEDDIAVGILVRLTPVKGLPVFINAAKEVIKANPKVKFLIGGEGEDRKSLENKVNALGISKNFYFLGFVNDPYEFMSCIDINTLTSISESFPYSILEGTRLKVATISSNVGGLSDLIDHGKNGYLFNPGDYKKLSEYILKLVNDSNLRKEMGERIYLKAREKFSLKNMCRTQLDIYEAVLHSCLIERKSKLQYDIIISGYYGFKNIGDDAMLMAIAKSLRLYKKDISIMVLSREPVETKCIYNVDSIYRFNILKVFRAMRHSKLFINGGGNLIQDNTSTRSLIYYLGMIWLAKKMGMKVMIYANGIGPINRRANRKLTKMVLNQVDIITLREEIPSRCEIDSLGIVKPEIRITADPALTIEPDGSEDIESIFVNEGIDPGGPYIGISVRKWHGYEKYEGIVAALADHMIDKYGLKPVFIPMHYPGDLGIIKRISGKMKGKGYVIKNKYSVLQIMGIIKKMDILVGMRLHALIFAASQSVPVVGMEYEPKVEGFLKAINQASVGHVENLELDNLIKTVEDVLDKRDMVKDELKKISSDLKNKALENANIAVKMVESDKKHK